jgi:hypothetical protein
MAQGSGCTIHIQTEAVPYHAEAYELADMGFIPAGAYRNRDYAEASVKVEEGISRTRNIASPQNCIRLNKNTPCAMNGVCGNCLSDTICDQIVITRASRVPQRIKVILIGEELGF